MADGARGYHGESMDSIDIEGLRRWVGRTQSVHDRAAPSPLAGLAALLDHRDPPRPERGVPPLAHWMYFLERERQSNLDLDGHPKRGGFLPPVPLPRRMWVGGRIEFLGPIAVDAAMERRSTIVSVTAKSGRTGPMVFVTARHEICVGGDTLLREEQDIVYRHASNDKTAATTSGDQSASPTVEAAGAGVTTRRVALDPVMLFRFSALTFNAHRIQYDRDYARQVEGYPGLVVHGPLTATLLMDHFLANQPHTPVRSFHFRARQPLFDTMDVELGLEPTAGGATLWARAAGGPVAFTAAVNDP